MTLREMKINLRSEKRDAEKDFQKSTKKLYEAKKEEDHLFKQANFINPFLALQLIEAVLKQSLLEFTIKEQETKLNAIDSLNDEIDKHFTILADAKSNKIDTKDYENDLVNIILNTQNENKTTLKTVIERTLQTEFNKNKNKGENNNETASE